MDKENNLHKDHRSRLRERYISEGLDAFEDHNALELLLFHSIPRSDTNPTAHRLIERFGSLFAVFQATKEELCSVPGIGEKSAELILTCAGTMRLAVLQKAARLPFSEGGVAYMQWWFYGKPKSTVAVLLLNLKGYIIACETLSLWHYAPCLLIR